MLYRLLLPKFLKAVVGDKAKAESCPCAVMSDIREARKLSLRL